MSSDHSDVEEPLSSIMSDVKNLSSTRELSEIENLEAIRKFIAEQEKEIQELELEQKRNQEKKSENQAKKKYIDNHEEKACQNVLVHHKANLKNNETKNEENSIKEEIDKLNEAREQEMDMSKIQISELDENADTNGNNVLSTSVMDMILSESDTNIDENDVGSSKGTTKQDSAEADISSSQKVTSTCVKGNSSISLSVGCKVEVKSFEGDWYAAEVAEVDYDEMEVLVRYEVDLKKTDEWVSVNSPRLRPYTGNTTKPAIDPDASSQDEVPTTSDSTNDKFQCKDKPPSKDKLPCKDKAPLKEIIKEIKEEPQDELLAKVEEKPKLVFEVGERCLARWRDNRRFCATIHKDLGDGKFEIIFDDGFHWICSVVRLHKMKGDSLSIDTSFQAATAGSPSPLAGGPATTASASPAAPVFHTHLFDPTRDYLGSKSERREKKRKLNIKEIFNIGQKKYKKQKSEEGVKTTTPGTLAPKRPRILKKPAPKMPTNVQKKEKAEIPDAVASIIGTVPKELNIKFEPLNISQDKQITQNSLNNEQVKHEVQNEDINDKIKRELVNDEVDISADDMEVKEDYDMDVDNIEPEGCIVNPNDDTLDDEDSEEPKSEGDPVLKEEVTLENFEKQDTEKHEAVIDKIKEAIIKLEGGINEVEKPKSPKVERMVTPIKGLETPASLNSPKLKVEVKPEDLKAALAEAVASIQGDESKAKDTGINTETVEVETPAEPKVKRNSSKIKKSKKLRLLQEKKVKRQVEKVKNELEQMKKQFEEMRQHMMSQEFAQSHESGPLPESFLFPGEWCCRWVNGQPVGRVSEIEGAPQAGQDSKPALPRRSVQVEDKRLPPGWTKHMVRRSVGHSAGKWDVVLVSPEQHGNKRFHTKTDMRHFLDSLQDDSLKEYEHVLLDFGVHLKISRRMGWIVNTPDGIAEGPETILPAGSTCDMSPLVKRRSLDKRRALHEKRGLARKSHKRRPIKLKLQKGLHSYNSQLLSGESSGAVETETGDVSEHLMPLEDGYVYVGSLKVQIIENLLRCPAEGCFKNFRTKTLLQMHIKHYHRELKAMMGATPKVLDLAYARQRVLPNKGDTEHADRKIIKVKINKPPKREEQKYLSSETNIPLDTSPAAPINAEEYIPLPKIPRSQDSPKLRQALIHKPVKRPRVLLPVRRLEPEKAVPDSINEELEDQLMEPVMPVPALEQPLDFETAISTHTVTKPFEKKRKADKKKSFASISKTISEDEEWFAMNSDELDTRSSFPRSGSPDSKADGKLQPMSSESYDDQKDVNLYTYTETGERIKIVHMKREEIINCHCGVRGEDGLMVQCELCLCWQHALCHNIQRECEVPEKYTCSICVNPRRGRRSRRFLHDQDRLYEGLLPGAKPCDSLRRSHELAGNLLRIGDALHALRVKYYVATKKDHPKLYLWAEEWEQAEVTRAQEKLVSEYSDLNIMINGMDKENLPAPSPGATPPAEEQDSDRSVVQRETQLGGQALLGALGASAGGAALQLPISSCELERLASSVQESGEWSRGGGGGGGAPQPEAAIEDGACRERLLRHIQRCHALLDTRLDSIEARVAELESQEPSFGESYETAEYFPRTKQTVHMLLRDLDTLEELGIIT